MEQFGYQSDSVEYFPALGEIKNSQYDLKIS